MFQALLNGKVSGNFSNIESNLYWRDIIKDTEDFLTAGVFGRLQYLSSEILEKIIVDISKSKKDIFKNFGKLQKIYFWQKFETNEKDRSFIEPDVLFEFENIDLIIEAKRYDNFKQQYLSQLKSEIIAHKKYLKNQNNSNKKIILLAIGGLDNLEDNLNEFSILNAKDVVIAISSWKNLLDKLEKIHINGNNLIISDIINILNFYGFKSKVFLDDLKKYSNNFKINNKSLNTLVLNIEKKIPLNTFNTHIDYNYYSINSESIEYFKKG